METPAQDTAVKAAPKFKSTIEALLHRVDQFKAQNKASNGTSEQIDASIGWKAVKDASIIERLRNGGDCTTRKLDAIIRYLSNPKRKV